MTEVTVDATWHLTNVNFNTASNAPANIWGQSEILMTAPAGSLLAKSSGPAGVNPVMPGPSIFRDAAAVANETVMVGGESISMQTIMDALPLFFERWRVEDAAPPVPPPDPEVVNRE